MFTDSLCLIRILTKAIIPAGKRLQPNLMFVKNAYKAKGADKLFFVRLENNLADAITKIVNKLHFNNCYYVRCTRCSHRRTDTTKVTYPDRRQIKEEQMLKILLHYC